MAAKVTAAQQSKWAAISQKCYADQCKWFLNGFWDELKGDAELIWGFCNKFSELDQEKKAAGNELDEFWSHKFLETLGETLTVIALREKLKQIDVDNNKKMSISEYLMFRYKKSVDQLINAPQGENREEMAKAQTMVDAAQNAVSDMLRRLEEQKQAVAQAAEAAAAAKKAEAEAKAAEAEAKARAADAAAKEANAKKTEAESKRQAEMAAEAAVAAEKAAQASRTAADESQAALQELKNQEAAYEAKKEELLKASQTGGIVQRNKAANQLEQLKSEDPTPLRRAKINQTAAVKKAEKAAAESAKAAQNAADAQAAAVKAADQAAESAKQAAVARKQAEESALAAEESAKSAEQSRMHAEGLQAEAEEAERQVAASVSEAERALEEAVQYLNDVKNKGGVAHGNVWWMEREIAEKKKYMPKRKQ